MRAKTKWTASVGSVVSVLVFGKMLALSVLDVGTPPKLEVVDITSVEWGWE